MAPSFMTNPSSAHTTTMDGVKKATVDRSLASDLSCPEVNPLYPQVGNAHIAIHYKLTDNVVRKNQLSEFEPVVSLISWLPPQVLAKLNIS
jgi:hypothetical protein